MRLIAISLCFGAALAAQTPVIQTETREVLVDAIVTGKNGAYIGDLTAKDFHVSQDGKQQTITSFSAVSASASAQTRSLVLFFDETSMEPRDQIAVRQAALSFIDAEAGPNHRIAIVTFNGSVRVVQNFTDNAGVLKDALNQASFHGLAPSAADSDRSHDPSRTEEDRLAGRGNRNALATSLTVGNMIRSLEGLGTSLGVLPGRKIVIVFTGTLPSATDQRVEMRNAVDAANKSGVAFYPVDVRPVFTQTDFGNEPTPQNRLPSYTQPGPAGPDGDSDPLSAPVTDAGSGGQQLLAGLANGTGGFVVQNTSNLLQGLQRIGQEQDQYYVLTYVPPESKEGSCHSLRVKVDRKGTKVRSRNSYCTERSSDLLAGTATGTELEKHAAATEAGDVAASMELPYFYVAPNLAQVHVAMEIQPKAIQFENKKGKLHAELNFLGTAVGADGQVKARFSDTLKLDFDNPPQVERFQRKPFHYEKDFKIIPGQYTLTISFAQGEGSSKGEVNFGKVQAPLVINPWTGDFTVSGIALSTEIHPAADLGLDPALGDRTPLIADGVQVVPSGSTEFAKLEPAYFYFEVYGPDAISAGVRARILDRKTGEQKWDGGFMKLPQSGNKNLASAGAKLPIDSLAPGSYELEITAANSAGKQIKRTVGFEVQ